MADEVRKEKKKALKQKKWEAKQQSKKRKLDEMRATLMGGHDNDDDDDEAILREGNLLKKLKRGKITEAYGALLFLSASFSQIEFGVISLSMWFSWLR